MPKYTKEELAERINGLELDEKIKVSLMEDITDSMVDVTDSMVEKSAYDDLQSKYDAKENEYNDLLTKYKERFYSSDNMPVKEEKLEPTIEKEVIDVKELF